MGKKIKRKTMLDAAGCRKKCMKNVCLMTRGMISAVLGALVCILGGMAYGQQYAVTGTTAGGGEQITGSGILVALSSSSVPVSLSTTGFDEVTLSMGSTASANNQNTISFTTSNDTLLNNGSVIGGAGINPGDAGFNAISFVNGGPGGLSGETLVNSGSAAGGSGANGIAGSAYPVDVGNGGAGGIGIGFGATGSISNITLTNAGSATGGAGGSGGVSGGWPFVAGGAGGNGGIAIGFSSTGNLSGVTLTNNGSAIGGNGGDGGSSDSNGTGGNGGIAIGFSSTSGLNGITLANAGYAMGGSGGNGSSSDTGGGAGGNGGIAIGFSSAGSLNGITLTNNGSATGGGGGHGGDGGIRQGGDGGGGGSGIGLSSDSITGVLLTNIGSATGGSGGNGGNAAGVFGGNSGGGGNGMEFNSTGGISDITVTNHGSVTGGKGGDGGDFLLSENGSDGGDAGVGVSVSAVGNLTNFLLNNYGTIIGGNAGAFGGNGSAAILFSVGDSSNLTINNYGSIIGGNGGVWRVGGIGIQGNENNLGVNNWGVISAGSLNPVAVSFSGSGNTLTLLGHSVVNGLIESTGKSNVLVFAFSGLSLTAASTLHAELAPYLNGRPSNGSVTVRGATYKWDPMIVEWDPNIPFNPNISSSYQLQGVTRNQHALGANLDSATTNPPPGSSLFNLFNAIDTSGAVSAALKALSPQRFEIYSDIALANANFTTLEIDERLNNLRDGSESIDTTGFGGETKSVSLIKDGKTVDTLEEKSLLKKWGFFASGNGLFTNIDGNRDLQSSSFASAGTIMGVDGKVAENWVAGTFFNYEHTDADLDTEGSTAHVNSYGGGLYTGWHDDDFHAGGMLAGNCNNYDSQRSILFPGFNQVASASASGGQYDASVNGGYDFHLSDKVTVGPVAGLQYVYLDVSEFNESGAPGADLSVGSQNADSLRSRLGFCADYHVQIARVAFAAEVRAEWRHEYLNDSRGIDAALIDSGLKDFSVNTRPPERDAALVGAGVDFTIHDTLTVFCDYDAQSGQRGYSEQSVKGGLKFKF